MPETVTILGKDFKVITVDSMDDNMLVIAPYKLDREGNKTLDLANSVKIINIFNKK